MMMFQMGPFLRSWRMKLNITVKGWKKDGEGKTGENRIQKLFLHESWKRHKQIIHCVQLRQRLNYDCKVKIVSDHVCVLCIVTKQCGGVLWYFLTPKAHEEAEKNRIEEAKADCKNVLMDHRRHCKHKQHGCCSETLLRHLEWQMWREDTSQNTTGVQVHCNPLFYTASVK